MLNMKPIYFQTLYHLQSIHRNIYMKLINTNALQLLHSQTCNYVLHTPFLKNQTLHSNSSYSLFSSSDCITPNNEHKILEEKQTSNCIILRGKLKYKPGRCESQRTVFEWALWANEIIIQILNMCFHPKNFVTKVWWLLATKAYTNLNTAFMVCKYCGIVLVQ